MAILPNDWGLFVWLLDTTPADSGRLGALLLRGRIPKLPGEPRQEGW